MGLIEYQQSKELSKGDPNFYALIMAAMRKADSTNMALLGMYWPEVYKELTERYWAPGGALTEAEFAWLDEQEEGEN